MIYKTEHHNMGDIQSLLTAFVDESVYETKVNPEGVKRVVGSPNTLVIVVYNEDKPVAIFMGYTYNHPMFFVKFSADLLLYVSPEHRGSPIAVRLMKMYQEWAHKQNVNYIAIGQSTGIGDATRVRNFYEKLGFKMTGFNCLKEPGYV